MTGTPNRLIPIKSPALPLAPTDYARQYVDQVNNISRIFYKQIDNLTNALLSNTGGRFFGLPHASLYDTTTQSDGVDTPNAIKLNSLVGADTLSVAVENDESGNPTRVTPEFPGVYNIQFSLQLENQDNAQHDVYIWLRHDGVNVADTATSVTVPPRKSAGVYGYAVAAWNFFLEMDGGDYFELMWATNSTLVSIPYLPAQTSPYPRPAVPSAILTVSFVSAIPA